MSAEPYTPPSSPTSCPPYEKPEDVIKDLMEPSGKDYKIARKKALVRDGFRCILTGLFDETSLQYNAELQRKHRSFGGMPAILETSHILSESTGQCIGTTIRTHYAPGVMTIMRQLGLERLSLALEAADGDHGIWNLLSLEIDLHSKFNGLDLWFKGTRKPNCYEVCVSSPYIEYFIRRISVRPETSVSGSPMVVDLSSKCGGAPPPDPQMLALHAACARVAHMSGAAEFLNKLEQDAEASPYLLSNLMSPYAVVHGVA